MTLIECRYRGLRVPATTITDTPIVPTMGVLLFVGFPVVRRSVQAGMLPRTPNSIAFGLPRPLPGRNAIFSIGQRKTLTASARSSGILGSLSLSWLADPPWANAYRAGEPSGLSAADPDRGY